MKTNILQGIANKIVELVRPSKIAEVFELSSSETEALLSKAIVLGYIRRSDVLFTLPQNIREEVERLHLANRISPKKIYAAFQAMQEGVDECEVNFLCALAKQRVVYCDLYELLSEIETTLHKRIQQCLQEEFRTKADAWWREGVPSVVRKSCATKREEDSNPSDDLYTYTTLIELKKIIEGTDSKNNWNCFSKRLPKGAQDKKQFLASLDKLNPIRNRVMHPIRLDEQLGETEYRFVSQVHNTLVSSSWNLKADTK